MSRHSIWWTRTAALLIVVWVFGSYGLSRHGHEPFPTGQFPAFANAPIDDGVATATDIVVVATFGAENIDYQPNELLGETGVSLDQVFRVRLRSPHEPSGGLTRITWNLVGPGSPLRRNQPLDYKTTDDTEATFVSAVEAIEGRIPDSVTVDVIVYRFDADSGEPLSVERSTAAVICEECRR